MSTRPIVVFFKKMHSMRIITVPYNWVWLQIPPCVAAQYLVPFLLNQCGSLVYYYTLSTTGEAHALHRQQPPQSRRSSVVTQFTKMSQLLIHDDAWKAHIVNDIPLIPWIVQLTYSSELVCSLPGPVYDSVRNQKLKRNQLNGISALIKLFF